MIVLLFLILLLAELFYFRIADNYGIVDKPTSRGSHNYITRRGGGIIVPFAWLLFSVYNDFALPYLTVGLLMLAFVSFIDDVKGAGVFFRLFIHTGAVVLGMYEFDIFSLLPVWAAVLTIFIGVASLNAVNFMDGINGITGLYGMIFWISAALLGTISGVFPFLDLSTPYPYILISLMIFGFYNFRSKAICFAGDVGSISLGYLMLAASLVMVLRIPDIYFSFPVEFSNPLLNETFGWHFVIFLAFYGLDSFLTIIQRIIFRENLLKGHRHHLYQYLVNGWKIPHLSVAIIIAAIQFGLNVWALTYKPGIDTLFVFLIVSSLLYAAFKTYVYQTSEKSHILPALRPPAIDDTPAVAGESIIENEVQTASGKVTALQENY